MGMTRGTCRQGQWSHPDFSEDEHNPAKDLLEEMMAFLKKDDAEQTLQVALMHGVRPRPPRLQGTAAERKCARAPPAFGHRSRETHPPGQRVPHLPPPSLVQDGHECEDPVSIKGWGPLRVFGHYLPNQSSMYQEGGAGKRKCPASAPKAARGGNRTADLAQTPFADLEQTSHHLSLLTTAPPSLVASRDRFYSRTADF